MGELTGGGCVAVAVGVSDPFCTFLFVLVSMLLATHFEIFSVSRMQDFSTSFLSQDKQNFTSL